MFIGHFALGFAAKPAVPRVSLAMLLVAALFADILWPVLVLLGFEAYGGSLGKRVLSMRSVRYKSGEQLGIPRAFSRLAIRAVFLSPGILAFGNAPVCRLIAKGGRGEGVSVGVS